MTGRLAATVERRPQVQDLLTRQKPLVPQVHQRSRLSLVMSRTQVLNDPAHTALLDHDLDGRGPRGGFDLTQVRIHPPDSTAALVLHNNRPTPQFQRKTPL